MGHTSRRRELLIALTELFCGVFVWLLCGYAVYYGLSALYVNTRDPQTLDMLNIAYVLFIIGSAIWLLLWQKAVKESHLRRSYVERVLAWSLRSLLSGNTLLVLLAGIATSFVNLYLIGLSPTLAATALGVLMVLGWVILTLRDQNGERMAFNLE